MMLTWQSYLTALVIVAVVLFVALSIGLKVTEAKLRICVPAEVSDYVIWRNDKPGVPYPKNDKLFASLKALNGPTFWVHVGDYGDFDIPKGYNVEGKFWLLPSRNVIWFASDKSQPDRVYVFWFWDEPLFADLKGQHYGIHPCRAFVITRAQADAVYVEAL